VAEGIALLDSMGGRKGMRGDPIHKNGEKRRRR